MAGESESPLRIVQPNGVLTALAREGFRGSHATRHGAMPMTGAAWQGPARDHGLDPVDPGPAGGHSTSLSSVYASKI